MDAQSASPTILQGLFTLVAVALGSIITLIGVGLQLRHSTKEKRKEREHSLKRDVYLQAAEGIATGQHFLASFGRLDIDDATLASLIQGSGGWVNKVHAVASLDTVETFIAAQQYLASNAFKMTVERAMVRYEMQQVETLQRQEDQLREHLQQIIAASQQLRAEQLTPEAIKALPNLVLYVQDTQKKLSEIQAEITQRQDHKNRRHLELLRESLRASANYSEHVARVNVKVRKELHLPIDENRYQMLVRDSSEAVLKEFESTIVATARNVLEKERSNLTIHSDGNSAALHSHR